jgi:hypothetical protein
MEELYFVFKTGYYTEFQSKWNFHEIKIPAFNVKEAVVIFSLHRNTQMKLSNQWLARKTEFIYPTAEQFIKSFAWPLSTGFRYKIGDKMILYIVNFRDPLLKPCK